MRVVLKGLHKVSRRLADGSKRMHFYAWRGGPRIEAQPGTAAFVEEFQRLTAGRDDPSKRYAGMFQQLINDYQRSPSFTDLAASTREGYARRIRKIETEYGDMPISAIDSPAFRGDILDWRDRLAKTGAREADYTFSVLARILSWAHDRRKISSNPAERPGRLSRGSRAHIVWTDAETEALIAAARPHVALPFRIALDTGQREGDILRLTWGAYDGHSLMVRQSKTSAHLAIPVTAELRAVLDAEKMRRGAALTICTTSRGQPWTLDGYKTSFAKARAAAGIKGRTFHDTRGTAVLRLARAGCSIPEIYSITGHDPKSAEAILAKHYLSRDSALAISAVEKLEKHKARTQTVNRPVNGPDDQAE